MALKPIADRADVALDFPEKLYIGSFAGGSGFEVGADPEGVTLRLAHRHAEKRAIELHLHYYLFADILSDLATSWKGVEGSIQAPRRDVMRAAAERLCAALGASSDQRSTEPGEP